MKFPSNWEATVLYTPIMPQSWHESRHSDIGDLYESLFPFLGLRNDDIIKIFTHKYVIGSVWGDLEKITEYHIWSLFRSVSVPQHIP